MRRSITGRTRANGTAGWQPRLRKVRGYRHLPALRGRAETIIALQKKVAEILETPLTPLATDETD